MAATLAGVVLAAAVIGGSRLALGVHTVLEVVIGVIVGTIGLLPFAMVDLPRPRVPPVTLVVGFLILAALLHGTRLRAEQWISMMSCRF